MKQALDEFHEILASIPQEEKGAYLQAMDRCPELIERESSPRLFLKYKDFQVWAAVQTFIEHWEFRLELFKEDAFLPINFTGRGAVPEKDIALLEAGEFCFLPDDVQGNPTMMICPRKTTPDMEGFLWQCMRVSFACRLICAHRQASEGYNVVYIPSAISGKFMTMPDFAKFLKTHDLIPSPQRGMFTVIPPSVEDSSMGVAHGISANKETVWNYLKPLSGESKEQLFQHLKEGGFRKEGVPTFLGGSWDESEFMAWLREHREDDPSSNVVESPPKFVVETKMDEEQSSGMDEKLREFHHVLKSLPAEQKQAYLKAREQCPHLIERESHPLLFLKHKEFDVSAAVESFVGFWELRVELLTEERAFLPLNLTGKGAIDDETCKWIESGAVAILPKDNSGTAQLLLDTRKSPKGDQYASSLLWVKALFALRVLLAQRATREGYSMLYFHNDVARGIFQAYAWYKEKFRKIPQNYKGIWGLVLDESKAKWLEANKANFSDKLKPVFGTSPQEFAKKLQVEGFRVEGLPESMGGSWNVSAFTSWVEDYRNEDPTASVLSPPTYAIDSAGASEKIEKLREFHAILSSLAEHEKLAYLMARERCPDLIDRECPPRLFLKSKNYHVWAAVQEFVRVWEFRHDLFGERAFLPMNLTGSGAPNDDDIALIESGQVAFAPCEDDGSLVLVVACSSTGDDVEIRSQRLMRALFFLRVIIAHAQVDFSVIQKHSDVHSHLYSSLTGTRNIQRYQFLPPFNARFFPILTVDNEEARRDFYRGVDTYKNIVWQGLNPFVAITDSEICENLQRKGFKRDMLPECVGGSWDIANVATWVREHRKDNPTSSLLLPPSYATVDRMVADTAEDEDQRYGEKGTETSVEGAIARLTEVIRLLPDGEEKAAYMEALSQAPALIQQESNPLWYLRAASFDSWDAAKRLATYWHYRKRWFGERAYLPLEDLSGNGALSVDDIESMRNGTVQHLPDDKDGRPVVFFRRLPSHSDEASPVRVSRLRTLLYLMTLAHKKQECWNLGMVFIIYYGEDIGHFRPFHWRESEAFTSYGIASRNTTGYLLSPQQDTTGPAQIQIIKEVLVRDITVVALSDERSENLDKMRSIGLSESGVPEDLGGSWTRANFESWLEQQASGQAVAINRNNVLGGCSNDDAIFAPATGSGSGFGAANEEYVLLARLESALSDIGLSDKIDLLTARERAPALVASESPPARFLRCDNFDFSKAARRWCSYWRGRKSLFGSKALLSMKSYDSLLAPREKLYLESMLSRSIGVDREGRSIIVFLGRRPADSGLDETSLARCYFVLFQHFVKNDMSQTDGIVLFREWLPAKFLPSCYKRMDEMVTKIMPVRVFAQHLLCVLPESGKLSYFQSISSRLFGVSSDILAQKTNVHLADSREGLREQMNSLGMDSASLPESLNEVWDPLKDTNMAGPTTSAFVDDRSAMSDETPAEDDHEFDINAIEGYMARLDPSETAAFVEAQKAAPGLIFKESDPRRFLALEQNRRMRAVRRLARYWTEKKQIFGKRAFLPLDQTGEGALSKDDIVVLNSGFLSVLRNDEQNVPVGILDGSRAVPQQIETALRIMFYVGSILCEYDVNKSMTCRFVLVTSVLSLDCGLDKLFSMLETALPTTLKDIFIIPTPSERGKASFFNSVAPQIIKQLGPRVGPKVVVIKGDRPETRGTEMVRYGFAQKALPMVAGGEWNFAQFFQWQESRVRIEWGLPLSTVQKASVPKGISYNVPNLSELPEPEQNERKRRLNLLHSRRKREKERAQIEALQEQVADLEETKSKLSEENARFEDAFRQASQYLPESATPPMPPTEDCKVSSVAEYRNEADDDSTEDASREYCDGSDQAIPTETAAVAAPSSGNKRILEEFLLQQQRVSVPSSVWLHMMNNRQTEQEQQNAAMHQFFSSGPVPPGFLNGQSQLNNPLYLHQTEDDRKKRRFL
eukprot:scaffold25307_cov168-Amphora_coffeaeformis.AAC.9